MASLPIFVGEYGLPRPLWELAVMAVRHFAARSRKDVQPVKTEAFPRRKCVV